MAQLRPAYLVHGDDHGGIAERRGRLRALVEREQDATVEVLEGERATPAGLAAELAALTLAVGRRVILVDGVERWRAADVEKHLRAGAGLGTAEMPPQTTVALFAREESRTKAPEAVHELVKAAGGQVIAQMNVKPWELPKWVVAQAAQLGLELDDAAARMLTAQVGERQQLLVRELEKLALYVDVPEREADSRGRTRVGVEEIEALSGSAREWRAFALADALLARDARAATLMYVRLRAQGERLAGLSYLMAQRLRDALACALELRAGAPAAAVKRKLRLPARAAEQFMRDVARAEPARLREALATLADLEVDVRGGAMLAASRTRDASLEEDTLVLRAITRICA